MRNLDAVRLLTPFLDVVRSGDTSGPITAVALSSVDKFITYGLVHKGSPNLAQAMTAVAGAGTHCKFEASDSVSDEVVLLKILDVLKDTLTSDLGDVLSDEAVCEMMETGLSMCCQMRLSGKRGRWHRPYDNALTLSRAIQKCFAAQRNVQCKLCLCQSSRSCAVYQQVLKKPKCGHRLQERRQMMEHKHQVRSSNYG